MANTVPLSAMNLAPHAELAQPLKFLAHLTDQVGGEVLQTDMQKPSRRSAV